MSEYKHAPGPWTYTSDSADNGSGQWFAVVDADGDPLLEFPFNASPAREAECEANARLIAAAPDLLAAFYEARDWMLGNSPAITALRAKTDAAIAKATGITP